MKTVECKFAVLLTFKTETTRQHMSMRLLECCNQAKKTILFCKDNRLNKKNKKIKKNQ